MAREIRQILTSPKLMGVLNVTPDSFYDGSRYPTLSKAISHAQQMADEGADVIDVGGESTRPFAIPVSEQEELSRVIPVIEALKKNLSLPIAIDTRHLNVMKAAVAAGASMVNDVNALLAPGAVEWVASQQVSVCLMHMQKDPTQMQKFPRYQNVVKEVYTFLQARLQACLDMGIHKENIWLDPGFGFGKSLHHNLSLLSNLSFFQSLGCPILVGLSRKSMFGEILNVPPEERLSGSLAATTLALLQGVNMVRTHDVAQTKQVLGVVKAIAPYWQEPLSREKEYA